MALGLHVVIHDTERSHRCAPFWLSERYLATLDLVQQGLGWAYLPQPLIQPLITSGAFTEVVFDNMPSRMRLWVDIIWVKNRPLGLGAIRYLSLMREIVQSEPRHV
jgi:DNA-binding transcriptional LysR family regulator